MTLGVIVRRNTEQRKHGRIALVFISYTAILIAILSSGLIGAWRVFEKVSPIDLTQKVPLIGVILVFAGTSVVCVVLIYIANICWLLVARRVFSKEEAGHLVFYGPTSRFDRWLFNKAFPDGSSIE